MLNYWFNGLPIDTTGRFGGGVFYWFNGVPMNSPPGGGTFWAMIT
jgi:hypothetical protein